MISGALGKISKLCPYKFFVMQIRVIFAFPLPSSVPPPLVPWAAAPVAFPSIRHCLDDLAYFPLGLQSCCSYAGATPNTKYRRTVPTN